LITFSLAGAAAARAEIVQRRAKASAQEIRDWASRAFRARAARKSVFPGRTIRPRHQLRKAVQGLQATTAFMRPTAQSDAPIDTAQHTLVQAPQADRSFEPKPCVEEARLLTRLAHARSKVESSEIRLATVLEKTRRLGLEQAARSVQRQLQAVDAFQRADVDGVRAARAPMTKTVAVRRTLVAGRGRVGSLTGTAA
jgi:hypothetical protein